MGPDLVDVLRRLGLHSLGDLAALPVASVVGRFGREGLVVHRLARGLDERPPATGEHLGIDVDLFDDHLAAAAQAGADGAPSLTLQHYIAAVDLHRGDLHADVPGAGWFLPEREHHRRRFVQTAVRAGQLLLGRGDAEHARALAHRALAVDQRSESAYAVRSAPRSPSATAPPPAA